MNRSKNALAPIVAVALLAAAVGGYGAAKLTGPEAAEADKPAATETEEAAPTTLDLDAQAIGQAGIEVMQVKAGGLASEILAQATIAPQPSGHAVITARASGTITQIRKRLGDPVRAGETLAVVQSRDAAQIVAERSAAAARANLAQKTLARERSLFEQRVSPRVDVEQAEAEAAAADAELRRANAAAAAARVSGGDTVAVVSPISGRVSAVSATLGAYIQPEAELFQVADPRLVQVEAVISGPDAARVAAGDRAVLETPDGRTVEGRVRSVTPSLDPETRSATAVLDMATTGLAPGSTARARIFPRAAAGASSAIVAPEDAVQTLNGKQVVFVRTAKGFSARPVTTGQRGAGRVEVTAGLAAGDTIATRNAFLLKAELAKGEGEDE